MPSRPLPRTQLSLDLAPRPRLTSLPVPAEAVPALADLLLAALGQDQQPLGRGGSDEQQDQR